MNKFFIFVIALVVLLANCANNKDQKHDTVLNTFSNSPAVINYTVKTRYEHDTTSFTEGLLVQSGLLFESTGYTDRYPSSRSLFGIVDKRTGKINVKAEIDKEKYFGEGIVFLNNKIYQLTLNTKIGFIYDAVTYKKAGEFHYEGEGWGLTTDGQYLVMSSGGSNIIYLDPVSFKPVKKLNVTDNNGPVSNINELEFINGYMYANQWLTDYIVKIDTATGKVLGRLDLSPLKAMARKAYAGSEETNGIAYDATADIIYVTGKLWPYIYEINFAR